MRHILTTHTFCVVVARIIKPQDDKEVVAGQSPPKSDATSTAAASAEPLIVQADEYRIIYKNFVVGQSFTKAESEADFNWFIREFEKDEVRTCWLSLKGRS
jgi:hypothetical protein